MVARTLAWVGHVRRLVVRDERLMTTDAGFFHIAGETFPAEVTYVPVIYSTNSAQWSA